MAALGAAYAFLRSSKALEWHALIGDSLSPVAAILSVVAVLAALWSVHVQRQELALQREELRETRDEMKAQREQFEKTAAAQASLAASQARLADAQEAANVQALRSEHARRAATLAQLLVGLDANAFASSREMERRLAHPAGAGVSTRGAAGDMNALGDAEDWRLRQLESVLPGLAAPAQSDDEAG